jgi:hypothetical protein
MGISFKVNITKKIKINGKEYGSVEEVPEQYRQAVQNALGTAQSGLTAGKITVNGIGYDSPSDMPPDVKATYEEALAKAQAAAKENGMAPEEIGVRTGNNPQLSINTNPEQAVKEEGGLSVRTMIILVLLAALAILTLTHAPR